MKKYPRSLPLYILLIVGLILFLSFLVYDQSKYLPLMQGHAFFCTPSPQGIFNDSLFHHTLPRCGNYRETIAVSSNNSTGSSGIDVHTNALGFRNEEYQIKKDQNTMRIIILGDSFAYGYGVDLRDTFYKQLEDGLNKQSGVKIEIWNLGVPSWSTAIHYYIMREKIRLYSPDYILLFLDESDFADNMLYTKMIVWNGSKDIGIQQNELGSGIPYYEAREKIQMQLQQGNSIQRRQHILEQHAITLQYLKKINQLSIEMSVPFEVVVYPYGHTAPKHYQEYMLPFLSNLSSQSIPYVDLYPYLLRKTELYSPVHLHWNEDGSVYVAGILFEHIVKNVTYAALWN